MLNSLDGLNGEDSDIALWYNTHPPALTRLTRLDELMEGRFDDYIEQPQNDDRFAKNISDLNK